MRFPFLFKRYVGSVPAGAVGLGTDSDPTGTANGSASQALLGNSNVFKLQNIDSYTNASQRVAVSLNAPSNSALSNPCVLTAFVYDELLQMWISLAGAQYGRQGSTISLNHKQIVWFNVPILNDRPMAADQNVVKIVAGQQGQLSPALSTSVMINSTNPSGSVNGEYDFLVGADIASVP
jgi:hypothetical protein